MHGFRTLLIERIVIKQRVRGRLDAGGGRVRLREVKEKIETLQRKESLCGAWLPLGRYCSVSKELCKLKTRVQTPGTHTESREWRHAL